MIRRAELKDNARLVEMGRAFFAEAGWQKHAEFDDQSFSYACAALMADAILLVAENGQGNVVGMVGAGLAPAYWNRKILTAQELFWYIEPRSRKGNEFGRGLMEALEAAAKSLGVMLFSMSAEEGLRSDVLGRLYRQHGYWPSERLFWKRLEPIAA
jgi:GNAT superfamily N-acetyltransferase